MVPKTSGKQKASLISYGIILSLVILEIGLRMAGFVFFRVQEYKNRLAIRNKGAYRIMCLGESTTALGGKNSYPSQLEEILNQRNIGIKFSVINKGWPGGYTDNIVAQLEENLNVYHPDMVITMMGINDIGENRPYEKVTVNRNAVFFRSLRVYKLARLIWLHLKHKTAEANISRIDEKESRISVSIDEPVQINNYEEKEKEFNRIIELNQDKDLDWRYIEFAWFCRSEGKYVKAEEMFKKAIEINPKNCWGYHDLGMCYKAQGKYDKAEEMFKKAIEVNPGDDWAYIELGWSYGIQRKYDKAEEMFKKAIAMNPGSDKAYAGLSLCYAGQGKYVFEKEYLNLVNKLRLENYNSSTRYNYQRLREIVADRGIKLVSVQYPVRSIEPLKKMLDGQKDIIFVDNEKMFREALRMGSYGEYFEDSFAGDFGHCTKKGNRLLSENIANVILENIFSK